MTDHAAALALLAQITPGPLTVCSDETVTVRDKRDGSVAAMGWLSHRYTGPPRSSVEVHATARAIAALPELAALYRAGVRLRSPQQTYLDWPQDRAAFDAALAAVADKLTGDGK